MPHAAQRPRSARLLLLAALGLALIALAAAGGGIMGWLASAGTPTAPILLVAGALAVGAYLLARRLARRLPRRLVLELDLVEPLGEEAGGPPWSPGGGALLSVLTGLERAAADPRVVALLVRLGRPAGGMAQVQELREAVDGLRAAGKRTVAFAETFSEGGPGRAAYYLATAFDEIVLQPSGDVGLTGVAAETTFLRGALDKLGVSPRLDHRREYKAAKNVLTERGFTPAHREATTAIVTSLSAQLVAGVARGRGVPEERARELLEQGPYLAGEAVEAGLVDRLAYRDEVEESVRAEAGGAPSVPFARYDRARREAKGPTIAVVHGTGAVASGRSRLDVLTRRRTMGSETLSSAFRQAAEDRRVRAVVFRIDSPGGSYVASDTIWRAVGAPRRAGKPVIVSMGNVAGSGGYLVALAGDRIVAQPATLTGSIGVVAGKAVVSELAQRLGLSVEAVATSPNASLSSPYQDYTEEGWERLQRSLDRVYLDFVTKVAEARSLSREQVENVARGRVWTGEQAQPLGLVDELGGLRCALRRAREAIGLPADAPVRLQLFPRQPRPLWARILVRARPAVGSGPTELAGAELTDLARRVLDELETAGILGPPGCGGPAGPVARMPALRLEG